jgi:hypothetical protein
MLAFSPQSAFWNIFLSWNYRWQSFFLVNSYSIFILRVVESVRLDWGAPYHMIENKFIESKWSNPILRKPVDPMFTSSKVIWSKVYITKTIWSNDVCSKSIWSNYFWSNHIRPFDSYEHKVARSNGLSIKWSIRCCLFSFLWSVANWGARFLSVLSWSSSFRVSLLLWCLVP